MNLQRRLALAITLVAVGLGAGHFVQSRSAGPGAIAGKVQPQPIKIEQLAAEAELPAPSTLPAASLPTDTKPAATAPATPVAPASTASACPEQLELMADENAMIGITLSAPCRADQRVVLKHAGLAVTARTTANGALFIDLPALEVKAKVELAFPDGEKISAAIDMPDAAAVQRFGVQWLDADAFQVHAFENGADYGQPGHVSAAAPQRPAPGMKAQSGFLSLIGDASVDLPMLAEIYTFPANGGAEVVVEAAVTEDTCGNELLGETISAIGGQVAINELTLAMPECAATGDIVVLKNIVPAMKLAAR